ncbi:MAG: hypothetical protein ACYTG5_08240 [Planctomycetota bacterium]|jgi:hypothetical protein
MTTPTLGQRLLPLVLYGWIIGAIRLALEFVAPDNAMYIGLYYLMPVGLLWVGLQYKWGTVRWTQVAGSMVLLAFCTWFPCNSGAYITGQFMEWQHGRFSPNASAALSETVTGKLWGGLSTGFVTAIAGSVWCLIWGSLVIWLPARMRASRG